MLLLNISIFLDNSFIIRISIHLMLLLNVEVWSAHDVKYYHFNTSYVVIKQIKKNKIKKVTYISIHLMLLLNKLDEGGGTAPL